MSSMLVFSTLYRDGGRDKRMADLVALINPVLSTGAILPPLATLLIFLLPPFQFHADTSHEQFRGYRSILRLSYPSYWV